MARGLKPRTPFAERLIAARGGMTRSEMADRLSCPLTTVAGWERGVSFPPPEILVCLSDLLQVSLDWLIAGRAVPLGGEVPRGRLVDEDLMGRICENIQILADEEGILLGPRQYGRLAACVYADLMEVFAGVEERRLGLRALLPQIRRDILRTGNS
ncbi:MAG: helix-turn-helix transcriptional regulator [Rhodospirillaceae bacterium]|nr:helix-turn-helix transcriptional regulator [Rhodospirillaceae bacterium]